MQPTKTYVLYFLGEPSEEARNIMGIFYIDGGGEDQVKELLFQQGIDAQKTSWSDSHMSFKVTKKTELKQYQGGNIVR